MLGIAGNDICSEKRGDEVTKTRPHPDVIWLTGLGDTLPELHSYGERMAALEKILKLNRKNIQRQLGFVSFHSFQ